MSQFEKWKATLAKWFFKTKATLAKWFAQTRAALAKRFPKVKTALASWFSKVRDTVAGWFSRENGKQPGTAPASGAKAKIILTVVICLLFILPVTVLFFALSSPSLPDVSGYDYLAMTDPLGKEYVYKSSDFIFLSTASAFSSAKHTSHAPDWWEEDRPSVKLEFIKDGYAYPYSLYIKPTYPLDAYLTDGSGNGYLISEESATMLVNTAAVKPALVGELPPNIILNGVEYGFSVCEWTFYIIPPPELGTFFTVSSGEYLPEDADPRPISIDSFKCGFSEQPKSLSFRIYRGEDKILDTIAPDFSSLPAGDYQLVVVATFERNSETVKAGYSFSFNVG